MYHWTPLTEEDIVWQGVDFDKTIASNSGHPLYLPGEPLPGAVEALQELDRRGFKITIFTARAWTDYKNIEQYCEHYNIPVRRIICGKPLLKSMIDDKNIEFDGDWDKALNKAINFK